MRIQIVLDGDYASLCEKLRVELGLKTYKSVVVDALKIMNLVNGKGKSNETKKS